MTPNITAAKHATQIFFLVCGLAISGWAPMVPFVKDRLQLSDSNLGLLLLFLGIGAFCAMPATGWLIRRSGSKLVMIVAAIVIAACLPVLAVLDTWAGMAAMLFVFGAGVGAIDVAMNTHGSNVQNVSGRHIMSSLHGLFSVGGLLGPVVIGTLLKTGLTLTQSAIILSILLLGLAFGWQSGLFRHDQELGFAASDADESNQKVQGSAWLNGTVLFLGAMCFISFLSEGAMLDWGALLLHDGKAVDRDLAGLGYTSFSIAMAVMRLAGDKLITRFNSSTVVLAGSIIAFIGYGIILLAPWLTVTLLGFVLIGIGCADIVPVFFSAAGSMKEVSGAGAVSAMGTIGYTGQLAGPAALGILAQQFTLPVALFITGVCMLIAGIAYWFFHVGGNKQKATAPIAEEND